MGVESVTQNGATYFKIGNLVFVYFVSCPAGMATIPTGYRPSSGRAITSLIYYTATNDTCVVDVDMQPTGVMDFHYKNAFNSRTVLTGKGVFGCGFYMI